MHTLYIPLWDDLSINLRLDKTSETNYSTECLSAMVKLIVLPKNLAWFAWIDGIISPLKEKGKISMTLPLSITIDLDLEALKDILVQIKAMAQQSRRAWVAGIDGDIKNCHQRRL